MSLTPVYLVDASIYLFRAWHSMPDEFQNHHGQPTNAVYGFTGFLCTLLEQTAASHVGVAFDIALTSSFRNDIYAPYKANREPAPEALSRQFAWAREVAEAMGFRCYGDERFEADDLIGTLARYWQQRGHPIVVVSGDKDLTQLLTTRDSWWDFARNKRYDSDAVYEKFGVYPEQIADYLALTGDAVDNIPGVPGVGPKTAAALLTHFGTLEALYERLDEIPHLSFRGAKTMPAKLRKHQQDAVLARRLTGIESAVESVLAMPDIQRHDLDEARLNRMFDELAFGAMLRRRCLDCR